jgi:hypothetical protein
MGDLNGVMLQTFQWHSRGDGEFWAKLDGEARELAARGYTAV